MKLIRNQLQFLSIIGANKSSVKLPKLEQWNVECTDFDTVSNIVKIAINLKEIRF